MAGLSANFEYDLKKIIALSTLSMIYIYKLGPSFLAETFFKNARRHPKV